MSILTIAPSNNSIYPYCTIDVDSNKISTIKELRQIIAKKYYVQGRSVIIIYKGKVLNDEIEMAKIGLRLRDRMNISINSLPLERMRDEEEKMKTVQEIKSEPTQPKRSLIKHTMNSHFFQEDEEQNQDKPTSRILIHTSKGSLMQKLFKKMFDYPSLRRIYAKQLAQLNQMGIVNKQNEEKCLRLLSFGHGNINYTMEVLSNDDYQ